MALPMTTRISIVQLVFFIPALLLSIWLCIRQGWRVAAAAWRFVVILALLRIIGASCEVVASGQENPSKNLLATVLSCDLIGIAPLVVQCFKLLSRVNALTKTLSPYYWAVGDVISLVGLSIGIAGTTKALQSTANGGFQISGYMIAAMALFLFNYVMFLVALGLLSRAARSLPNNGSKSEERASKIICLAGAACAPFMLVRLLYACIGDFGRNTQFVPYLGDPAPYLGMSVVMEIILIYICLACGLTLPPPPPPSSKDEKNMSRGQADDESSALSGKPAGPTSMV